MRLHSHCSYKATHSLENWIGIVHSRTVTFTPGRLCAANYAPGVIFHWIGIVHSPVPDPIAGFI